MILLDKHSFSCEELFSDPAWVELFGLFVAWEGIGVVPETLDGRLRSLGVDDGILNRRNKASIFGWLFDYLFSCLHIQRPTKTLFKFRFSSSQRSFGNDGSARSIGMNLNFSDLNSQWLWRQVLTKDNQLAILGDIVKTRDISMVSKSIHAIVNFPAFAQLIWANLKQLHHSHFLELLSHLLWGNRRAVLVAVFSVISVFGVGFLFCSLSFAWVVILLFIFRIKFFSNLVVVFRYKVVDVHFDLAFVFVFEEQIGLIGCVLPARIPLEPVQISAILYKINEFLFEKVEKCFVVGFCDSVSRCVDYDIFLMFLQIRENSFDLNTLQMIRLSHFVKVDFLDRIKINPGRIESPVGFVFVIRFAKADVTLIPIFACLFWRRWPVHGLIHNSQSFLGGLGFQLLKTWNCQGPFVL